MVPEALTLVTCTQSVLEALTLATCTQAVHSVLEALTLATCTQAVHLVLEALVLEIGMVGLRLQLGLSLLTGVQQAFSLLMGV